MHRETPRPRSSQPSPERPPSRRAQAIVRCKGFRCAAYQDKDGTWRSAADGQQLEVLEVVLRF